MTLQSKKKKLEKCDSTNFKNRKKLFELRNACMQNAIDLLKEAEILYKSRKYARCFLLSFIAFEEVNKHQIVSDYITDILSKSEFEEAFKRHGIKISYGKVKVEIKFDDIKEMKINQDTVLNYESNELKEFMNCRNNSMYVNFDSNSNIIEPKKVFKAKDAKHIMTSVLKELILFFGLKILMVELERRH